MSIDPVAGYAAVVATGALGWQVYQSVSDRKGKLAEREGILDIGLRAEWRAGDYKFLHATFVNKNDYKVLIRRVKFTIYPPDAHELSSREDWKVTVPADRAGLDAEIPPHDSLRHVWDAAELDDMLADLPFRPGYLVLVAVTNSLGHESSGGAPINSHDKSEPVGTPYPPPTPYPGPPH